MRVLPDIVGDNAVHPIVFPVDPLWIQFIATGGTIRIGDSSVSILQGLPVPAGGGMFMPPGPYRYMANDFFAFIPTGATLSIGFKR